MAENPRIEELRRRVQADPASIAFAALAEEFRRVGRYDDAVETCRTGLQRHPAYLSARVTLGRALIETGDFDAAREELETVLRSAPENLAAIRGLAQIHERLGHSTEMDPHLADLMQTMHAEQLRAAALAPPHPSTFAEASANKSADKPEPARLVEAEVSSAPESSSEPEPSFEPEPAFEPEPSFASSAPIALAPEPINPMAPQANPMAPQPALESVSFDEPRDEAPAPPSTDPFAAFAPIASSAPKHDLSFDLANAFSVQPNAAPPAEPGIDFGMAPPAEPVEEMPDESSLDSIEVESSDSIDSIGALQSTGSEAELDLELDAETEPEPHADPVLQMAEEPGPDPAVVATLARLERFLAAIDSLRA